MDRAPPHSPFVWGVLGAIAQATDKLVVGTGVTCPTFRTHPAIIAHAAATAADLMPGRFFLGVGTGENLNEHILGQGWPEWEVRAEMLEEAVEVIRELWRGEVTSHRGRYYTVQNARLYTLPEGAAADPRGGRRRAHGRGGRADRRRLHLHGPGQEADRRLPRAGGGGPRFGQVTVCWAASERAARKTAHEWWPTAALHGEVTQELPNPAQFTDLVRASPRTRSPRPSPAGRTRTSTSRRSRRTSTPATTTSTCTRSGRTRKASSTSPARSCSRGSERGTPARRV